MASIAQLRDLLGQLENTKQGNYDSTTTSHPSGSLDDGTSKPPGDGAPGKDMNATVDGQTPAAKPISAAADASTDSTATVDNPMDAPATSVGAGKTDTEPSKKDTKDDPGTSVPNAEVGEKYAAMKTSELAERFFKGANIATAILIKNAVDTPPAAKTTETPSTPATAEVKTAAETVKPVTNQDAAAAGYAAATVGLTIEKNAALRKEAARLISDLVWAAQEVGNAVKQANMEMMGGAPPMDPAAMGAGAAPPMDPAAMGGGGMPPAAPPAADPVAMGGAPAGAGAGAGGGADPLNELLSAILEAGYTPQDIEAALASLGGGGGAPPAAAPAGPPGGGGESKSESESEPSESEETKEAKTSDAQLLKLALAHWKSGKYEYVPAADQVSKTRRKQLKQAVTDIIGRR